MNLLVLIFSFDTCITKQYLSRFFFHLKKFNFVKTFINGINVVVFFKAYTCAEHEFTCESGKCIPKTFKCDGNMDCGVGDNSDEKDCGGKI